MAIFTKFDALEDIAYGDLEYEGFSHDDAVARAPTRAMADFEKRHIPELYKQEYPPRGHVYLRGSTFVFPPVCATNRVDGWVSEMDKPEADCCQLMRTVASVLDNNNLQRLFVSTQRNNLELCMEWAVRR